MHQRSRPAAPPVDARPGEASEPPRSRRQLGTPDENTFRILIATDNHLGYQEQDPIRKEDSFRTFAEVLQIAQDNEADFVLLGGDLFHDNKPTRWTLCRAVEIFRKYCFGDRRIAFEVLSDQSINFPDTACVNYEDPNVNISLPIFTIHGNHDDPAGAGGYSAMDLLSYCNLVNYWGKAEKVDEIESYPILVQKGSTKLALYGIGNIRDERLHRTFQQGQVKFIRPGEDKADWFNLCVIHQNRVKHSGFQKNYISDNMLPNFMDMIIWAHEHECLLEPEKAQGGDFYVSQPGSSVATSLSKGEAATKKVGIMEIKGDQYRIVPVVLETVRPFVMDEIVLSEQMEGQDVELAKDEIEQILSEKVEEMIARAKPPPGVVVTELNRNNYLPLIRLKVEYSGFEKLHVQRFGQKFVGKVANPEDVLLFHKQKTAAPSERKVESGNQKDEDIEWLLSADPEATPPIHDLVSSIITEKGRNALSLLSSTRLSEAVQLYVEKKDANSIQEFVTESLKHLQVDMSRDLRKDSSVDALLQQQTAAVAAQERKLMERRKQHKEADMKESQARPMAEGFEGFREDHKMNDTTTRRRNLDDLEDMSDGDAVHQVDLATEFSPSESSAHSEEDDDVEDEDVKPKASRKRAAPAAAKPRQRAKPAPKASPQAKPPPKPRAPRGAKAAAAAAASSSRGNKLTLACTSQGTQSQGAWGATKKK